MNNKTQHQISDLKEWRAQNLGSSGGICPTWGILDLHSNTHSTVEVLCHLLEVILCETPTGQCRGSCKDPEKTSADEYKTR